MFASAGPAAQPGPALRPALIVHACAETDVDDITLQRAAGVAERLLATAGVTATWRVCRRRESSPADYVVPNIVALLRSTRLENDPDKCGFAHRGTPSVGTALVSVRCAQEFTARISRSAAYRSHPLLASARYDDFLGVLMAHEIGHLLGLGHARTGVMRARFDADDIVAFRLDRLQFTAAETARLRAAVTDVRSTASAAGSR